jgi:hypothetical protein
MTVPKSHQRPSLDVIEAAGAAALVGDLLSERGWTKERLATNELWTTAESASPIGGRARFWRTIGEATRILGAVRPQPPVFLKCLREYPFWDSNVDLLVARADWTATVDAFVSSGWSMPSGWDRIEQGALERRKVKLTPPGRLLPVHLYGGVMWGYQRDTGLLRTPLGAPDMHELAGVSLATGRFAGAGENWDFLHPARSGELAVQAVHIMFENFRMTMGEAVHIQALIRSSPDDLAAAAELACPLGFGDALRVVVAASSQLVRDWSRVEPERMPRPLSARSLASSLQCRSEALRRSGRSWQSLEEPVTTAAFFAARRAVRATRRARTGREGRRHPPC